MVSPRSYGTTHSDGDALAELERCAGTQFDRSVVAAFGRVIAVRRQPAALPS
jgi:HD-GYP domain-containing protein (c-di-GMP phosphodiesterase class II)